jgi:hypothetical protein
MFRVGDRLSLMIMGLCCGGTFIALTLASVAKRHGQTGPPPKPDFPWLKDTESAFEQRMGQLNVTPSTAATPASGSSAPGSAAAAGTAAARGGGAPGATAGALAR